MISGKTSCGMQYAVKRSGSAVGYCALSIKCGTRDEEGYHSGIAHFAEHTIFKGTEHHKSTAINSYLDKLGGELNAYTTKEEIVIHATFLKEDFRKAATLLFELVTCPTFPENEINTEKGVVIDEINSYRDSPSEEIYDRFEEMLFMGHPLSGPILGTAASVRKITSGELKSFTGEKFRPEKMAFTVVADMDEAKLENEALKLAGKFFGSATFPEHDSTSIRTGVPANAPFDRTVSRRNHQVNCIIGGIAPSLYEERERLATILLCNILGGPATNSILNSVLREKHGWVYGVECSYTQYTDTGIATISLGCDKGNLDRCLRTIGREVGRLQAAPLSPARMKAAKKQLLGQLAISSDNGETQCLSMGKSLLSYGMVNSESKTREMIEGILAEDVLKMACEIFAPEKTSRLIFI